MKKQIYKQFLCGILAAILIIGSIPAQNIIAADTPPPEWQTCNAYDGTNTEAQDYSRTAAPITSYLEPCSDGTLLRVQSGGEIEGVLVEYYDASYQLQSSKEIAPELPIFGGFYHAGQYYFLLTGQNNPTEDPNVEVYRITKYDLNWNRIASAGLYDCNTTIPFRAGSARMDASGNYLLIRTCHEMYRSDDGKNHQANVTIQLDMQQMKITDSYTGKMNSSYGYVSHSFNQFIKVENNRIVAVDHGDAYPRSIVLINYPTDMSKGAFTPSYGNPCTVTNVISFPGAIGDNTTGASIGGFEISDSSYLIAGNSIIQDDSFLTRKTRNIFVAAVDKSTRKTTVNYLTEYAEGNGTTSTPQLVSIKDGRYMVLWSRENKVFYTFTDKKGAPAGETFELEGSLSDCAPIAFKNKLIWYTWEDEIITFYEIDLANPSRHQTKVIQNGHQYENLGTDKNSLATLKCTLCNKEETMTVITSMMIYWNTTGTGSYSTAYDAKRQPGETLYCLIRYSPSNADNQKVEVSVEDPEIVQWTKTPNIVGYSGVQGYFTMLKEGRTTITFYPRYNPALSYSYTCIVGDSALPQKPAAAMTVSHGLGTVGNVPLPAEWRWRKSDQNKTLTAGGSVTATAEYTDDYLEEKQIITITADAHSGGTATCAAAATCEICQKTYGVKNPAIHTGETFLKNTLAATCTEKGYTGDTYCQSCKEKLAEGTETDALGHNFSDWENISSSSCSGEAFRRICHVCGYMEIQETGSGSHTWNPDYTVDKAATCTENGSKSIHCIKCEAVKDSTEIPALGHDYTNGACSRCGKTDPSAVTPPDIGPDTPNPDITTPDTQNPDVTTPDTQNPDMTTPDTANPSITAPDKTGSNPPAPGTLLTDSRTKAVYKVTKTSASGNTVEYVKPTSGHTAAIVIPAAVTIGNNTYAVTGISANAFRNNKQITKVTIGNNVLTIGNSAFSGCTKLNTVTIGKNTSVISDQAFAGCTSLTKIIIPAKVSKIGKKAFYGNKKLKTIIIKTKKLTSKTTGKQAFGSIHKKAVVKVPSKKLKIYKKLLKTKGITGKKQKIKK